MLSIFNCRNETEASLNFELCNLTEWIDRLETEMLTAANNLDFEKAAPLRNQTKESKRAIDGSVPMKEATAAKPVRYRKGK